MAFHVLFLLLCWETKTQPDSICALQSTLVTEVFYKTFFAECDPEDSQLA